MTKGRLGVSTMILSAAAASAMACGGGGVASKPDVRAANATTPAVGGSCVGPSNARPIGKVSSGSTVAVAKIEGRRVAFVADEDAKAVLTVDLESSELVATTPLGGAPGQLLLTSDGRLLVTVRDASRLAVLTATAAGAPLTTRCSVATPVEPVGIAATPDESTVLVTTGWGRRISAFDGATLATKREAELPREPRAVVVSDDGKTAFVSHAVGSLLSVVSLTSLTSNPATSTRPEVSSIDLQGRHAVRESVARSFMEKSERDGFERNMPSCQGFALAKSTGTGRLFAPQVLVDPGELNSNPDGYGDANSPTEVPAVAVIDTNAQAAIPASLVVRRDMSFMRRDPREEQTECLLPRAAAVDAESKSLLVTCFGIDAVVAYDATSGDPRATERRRWTVGSGPTGVAVDPEKRRGVVWSQFDRTLSTFPLGTAALVDDTKAPLLVKRVSMPALAEPLRAEYALGRILFHAAGDTRVSHDGRACASCHPDGRDDAITWATPEGPRRTIMLAGRAARSAPYSWNGNESTLHNHLGNTFDRLSGRGLRSIELDALVTYLTEMPAPPQKTIAEGDAKIAKGRDIFRSAEAGCAGCHSGENFSDGKNHDVGSQHSADREQAFNTPSLRFVGGTGPYFHDGRYATLRDVLTKSDGKMGKTSHLAPTDLDALETFLRSL